MIYFVSHEYTDKGQNLTTMDADAVKALHAERIKLFEKTDAADAEVAARLSEDEILHDYEVVHWARRCDGKEALLRAVNEMVQ